MLQVTEKQFFNKIKCGFNGEKILKIKITKHPIMMWGQFEHLSIRQKNNLKYYSS